MRELTKKEYAAVSGGGVFSNITGFGLMVLGIGVGWTFGGPVGAGLAFSLYGIGKGSEAIYNAAQEGREDKRIENFDYKK